MGTYSVVRYGNTRLGTGPGLSEGFLLPDHYAAALWVGPEA